MPDALTLTRSILAAYLSRASTSARRIMAGEWDTDEDFVAARKAAEVVLREMER